MSQHMLGQLYRAVASHLKFAASQLYPNIAKQKSKRRRKGKKEMIEKEESHNVKDHLAKLILSLSQKLRSKDNIKLILLFGQAGFKKISTELGESYQYLDLTDLKLEQERFKNELCLQFSKEKQKFWQKYIKRIRNKKNQKILKPIVNHMLICKKLDWRIQNQIGDKKPREDLDTLLQNAKYCSKCSFQEIGIEKMKLLADEDYTPSERSLFNGQIESDRFSSQIQRELDSFQCEEQIDSQKNCQLWMEPSNCFEFSLNNILLIESEQNEKFEDKN